MFNFKDRTVIITGATGNLGVATARAFFHAEASLALLARSPGQLDSLIPELVNSPHTIVKAVDLLDTSAVERTFQDIQSRFGRMDILVNAVGGYRGGKPAHQTTAEDVEFLLDLNLRTVFNACRAVVPFMLSQSSGRIINVAARSGLAGAKHQSAYSIAKAGVLRLTESLSTELREAGINVNCLLPFTIDTPQNREAMPKADFSRWPSPESIAEVILFLASDSARAVHGAAIPV